MTEQNVELTEQERLAVIRAIVREVQDNGIQPNNEGQKIVAQVQEEKATEELVVNHGLLNAQKEDVEDEVDFLETEKDVDFDSDENEVDMKTISPLMREALEG